MLRLVHVPGLERLPGGFNALPNQWQRLLGRAQPLASDPDWLARQLAGALPTEGMRTALALPGDVEQDGWWLRFDPVVMQPDLTAVWIAHRLTIDFEHPQQAALKTELQAMFDAEGLGCRWLGSAGCGVLRLEQPPAVAFTPLVDVFGQRLDEVLPSGDEAGRWQRLMTESQMIFQQFRALDAPDQRGAGLWFWGGGGWIAPPASAGLTIVATRPDPEFVGLARWLDTRLDDTPEAWLKPAADRVLLHAPPDPRDPIASLDALYHDWLQPLGARSMVIVGDRLAWRVRPWDRLRFWQRQLSNPGFGGD
ncbi:MAG: hypothetical protein RQ729_08710 [Wenzhouxiangellaceae bacterium]|nr:hypothetical protein [Wenzhouxiangellaceae bacterium]